MKPSPAIALITCDPVDTPEKIQRVADLAVPIWREQFTPIIGPAQVTFMLEDWQSPPAITEQILHGTYYYLVRNHADYVGYCAWIPDQHGYAKISKFYLLHEYHGKGYAQEMMQFLEKEAKRHHQSTLWLQVNRKNHRAIHFYHKCGFHIARDRYEEIGPGYFIDDHVMEKHLQPGANTP